MEGKETACREGEIGKEFVRLNKSKEQLHNRLGILFDKLHPVLRAPEPKKEISEPQQQSLETEFAICLSSVSSTIETNLEKVNDILNRLEL